jgi:low affinity Fe/Cu permease
MRAALPATSLGGAAPSKGDWFRQLASQTSSICGNPLTFAAALAVCILWGGTGPVFHFSDTWQLVINTGTTVVTFLMVFLIQATQNRDTAAIQLKLDALILAASKANDKFAALEDMSDDEIDKLKDQIRARRSKATTP